MKIWAHRGCSQCYPENTLTAFAKAAELHKYGLTGIELDVQLTKDNQLVICHDERVDRTTDGIGNIRDFTLQELSWLHIATGSAKAEHIPTAEEVFDLLEPYMKAGLLVNIEIKNSVFHYPGIEQKIIEFVQSRGLEENIVYSSFYTKSLEIVRKISPNAQLGVLDRNASDCLFKQKNFPGAAIHPYWQAMDRNKEELTGQIVRAWFSGHLYPEKPTGTKLDLLKLEAQGITDIFINEPETYVTNL